MAAFKLKASINAVSFSAYVLPTLFTSMPNNLIVIDFFTFSIRSNSQLRVLSYAFFYDFGDMLEGESVLLLFIVA